MVILFSAFLVLKFRVFEDRWVGEQVDGRTGGLADGRTDVDTVIEGLPSSALNTHTCSLTTG